MNPRDLDRFWAKVVRRGPEHCWLITNPDSSGYGRFFYEGKRPHSHAAILDHYEPRPSQAHHALHKCDVKACANPAHLYWGTHQQNMRDRQRNDGWRRGRSDAMRALGLKARKLLPSQVDYVRALLKAGYSAAQCAKWYEVSRATVANIRCGRHYAQAASLVSCALLVSCASSPPADITAIHASVRQRISYQRYFSGEWRYVAPGTTGKGNCMVHAATAYVDLKKAGYHPQLRYCRLGTGELHVFAVADGWAVDPVLMKSPAPEGSKGCPTD